MARKQVVSRTIEISEIALLCVDAAQGECFNALVQLPIKVPDINSVPTRVMKLLNESVKNAVELAIRHNDEASILYGRDAEDVTVVRVLAVEMLERTYEMPLEEFMQSAHVVEKED